MDSIHNLYVGTVVALLSGSRVLRSRIRHIATLHTAIKRIGVGTMRIGKALLGIATAVSLIGLGTSAAYAVTINFDQRDSGATGDLSFDGSGGPLVGNDISFSFVSSPDHAGSVDCSGCLLNFSTGNFASKAGRIYTFDGGGSFELSGDVVDGGTTLASGSLLSGEFAGPQTFLRLPGNSGSFVGNGTNVVDNGLAAFFGIDPDSDFMFLTTNFSIGNLTFNGSNDGFSGDVDAADLATTTVPEPQELGIFGLGLALMIGSLVYRRRKGASNLG